MTNDNNRYQVPILINAGRVLQFLSRYKTSRSTLAEISQALDINKSSCFRILRTLQDMNYVRYENDSKRYSLGSYLVLLGSRAFEQIDYLTLGKDYLRKISKETGFNSAIVQKISDERLTFIAKEEVERSLQVSISIGSQFPLSRTSFGKCYLAYSTEEDRKNIFSKGLQQATKYTITDINKYLDELDKVRAQGYAISFEEYLDGISVASAPVFNSNGDVLMVLCCIGISAQFSEDKLKDCGKILKYYADKLTIELNGVIPKNTNSNHSI